LAGTGALRRDPAQWIERGRTGAVAASAQGGRTTRRRHWAPTRRTGRGLSLQRRACERPSRLRCRGATPAGLRQAATVRVLNGRQQTDDRFGRANRATIASSVLFRPVVRLLRICATRQLFPCSSLRGVSPHRGGAYGRTTGRADGSRWTQSATAPAW